MLSIFRDSGIEEIVKELATPVVLRHDFAEPKLEKMPRPRGFSRMRILLPYRTESRQNRVSIQH